MTNPYAKKFVPVGAGVNFNTLSLPKHVCTTES